MAPTVAAINSGKLWPNERRGQVIIRTHKCLSTGCKRASSRIWHDPLSFDPIIVIFCEWNIIDLPAIHGHNIR